MKTIFISAFEGVETKNILRTDVLPTLLSCKDLRIVLLMKSAERVAMYKDEFADPRIIFEITPYARRAERGWDGFFSALKFTLLDTPTKDLQRRFTLQENRNYAVYYFGSIFKFLFAHPIVRKFVRKLDFILVRSKTYAELFDKYNPNLVFLAHLFEEPEINILREAKHRGVKTVGLINSWDKVTSRCIMRLLPDKLIVFNNIVKNEVIVHDEMKEEDIYVSGLPQYDCYFLPGITKREDFFKQIGLDSQKKMIVFSAAGRNYIDSDRAAIGMLYRLVADGKFSEKTTLLVRFPPNDLPPAEKLKNVPDLAYDYPGIHFAAKRGVDWDMSSGDTQHLKDTLHHASIIVSYASSMAVDAAVFNKPIINLYFEINKPASSRKATTFFYKVDHYKNILSSGGVKLASSEEELVNLINRYLLEPKLDEEKRKKLVVEQCVFTDGLSGERIGKYILQNIYG